MLTGAHVVIYTKDAEADPAFLKGGDPDTQPNRKGGVIAPIDWS